MTWKSFKSVDVEIFIESATLRDFISLANNTIPSFMSAYNLNLPDFESDEFKFFMAIGGTITNISAQKSGREYMLKEKVGLQLLDTIIKIIVEIPMPKGKILKR